MLRALRNHYILVALLFLMLGWLVSFGSGKHLETHSYGGPFKWDAGPYMWFFWHLKQWVTGHSDLFFTDRLFYPHGLHLIRQDSALVPGIMALPFQAFGPLAAYNLQILLGYVFTGLSTYLLAFHLSRSRLTALLAALIFTFSEFRILKAHFHGQPGHVHQEFIPLYLLCMLLYFRRSARGYALGAGLCFFLAAFTNPYQLVFLLIFTLLFYGHVLGLAALQWARAPRQWRQHLVPPARQGAAFALLAGGTAAALVVPLLLPNWEAFQAGAGTLGTSVLRHPADLASYVTATMGLRKDQFFLFNESWVAFQGYSVLALFAASLVLVRWRSPGRAGLWLLCGGLFFLLSLGDAVMIRDEAIFELPFFPIIQQLPIIRGVRLTSRFASMVTLCVALVVALALSKEHGRLGSIRPHWLRAIKAGLVAVVALELLAPRLMDVYKHGGAFILGVPPPYLMIAQDPDDVSVVPFPLVWESRSKTLGPHKFPRELLTYQMIHGKRLVTGYGDAIPGETLEYFARQPLLSQLLRLEQGLRIDPPDRRHRLQVRALVDKLEIRYFVLHKHSMSPDPEVGACKWGDALRYLRATLPVAVTYEDPLVMLVKVLPGAWRPAPGKSAAPAADARTGTPGRSR